MKHYQRRLVELMLEAGVLAFGEFTTKSGRHTPYFINTGLFRTGDQLSRLADAYAARIVDEFPQTTCLFGPAYKGIPLACATAVALSRNHGMNVSWSFNRKEEKDHGEGGMIVGHTPTADDATLIIEDVTTAGTSVRETIDLFASMSLAKPTGLLVSIDRQERGTRTVSALAEVAETHGIKARAIVTIGELLGDFAEREVDGRVWIDSDTKTRIETYLAEWGPVPSGSL